MRGIRSTYVLVGSLEALDERSWNSMELQFLLTKFAFSTPFNHYNLKILS